MPPSRHSSSSHSSSHHSSSHSSSRSSSSSSRSYSSSRSSGPSRHSSSSHSSSSGGVSRYTSRNSPYISGGMASGHVIQRNRVNQPTGWKPKEHGYRNPEVHYCVRHNYVYYPADWFDESTSKGYRKGYYDEDGTYYEDVVFKRNGKYENIICRCDYCGAVTKVDWSGDGQAPNCQNCGAVMRVESAIDEYTQDPGYSNDGTSYDETPRSRFTLAGCLITIISFLFIAITSITLLFSTAKKVPVYEYVQEGTVVDEGISNVDLFGSKLKLTKVSEGVYKIVQDGTYEKSLSWDAASESYYDPETDCYLWYNIDVSPAIWQYWYEGISSDYGEYGWMEWDESYGEWWIEKSWDEWDTLPSSYDSSYLWHIEE